MKFFPLSPNGTQMAQNLIHISSSFIFNTTTIVFFVTNVLIKCTTIFFLSLAQFYGIGTLLIREQQQQRE
jgi:hypothetical protein